MHQAVIDSKKEVEFWSKQNPDEFLVDLDESERLTNLKPSTKNITLRVPEHLLNNIRMIANKRDIPYQSLLKMFLQEKVNEELQTPFLALRKKVVKKAMVTTFLLLGLLSITYGFVVSPIKAAGTSMDPNFPSDTYYLMDKIGYSVDTPKRGDVIVFHSPTSPKSMFFKRIIALPGERLAIHDGAIYINGEKLYEPYTDGSTESHSIPEGSGEITIPGNSYYVLGDNRATSTDSREFGFLPRESIVGKVAGCYWHCQ